MGLLLDEEYYQNTPQTAPLMRGDYQNLPKSMSIKSFAPTPGHQGLTGTCTGWATAYGGRTILSAINQNWEKDKIDQNVYSPYFIYNLVKGPTDTKCSNGASMDMALDALKDIGCLSLNEFGNECKREIKESEKVDAAENRIFKYRQLFYDKNEVDYKINNVKKSIAESLPVVIGMHWPFGKVTGDVIQPKPEDYTTKGSTGHAVVIVSYDDDKYGGAFEIMNSWGKRWANSGFVWMKYADFNKFCYMAFELFEIPRKDLEVPDLSGSIQLITKEGAKMELNNYGNFFETKENYFEGTFFKVLLKNNEPAFIYAFGVDYSSEPTKLFPFNERTLAYFPYSTSNFALPDEDNYYMIDDSEEASYFCFLYSKDELDFDSLLKQQGISENPVVQIPKILQDKIVDKDKMKLTVDDSIQFESRDYERSIIPIIIKIKK
ncbi:MAG: C1 family peptidase [Bacteroidetes bacterium]|nr:C1 family peptidase [Bacteroidota bacterium]